MKKTISTLVILFLFAISAASDASYLIRLKNGGKLPTPLYWFEGAQVYFFYAGGTVGIGRGQIDRIEKIENMAKERDRNTITEYSETKGPAPLPSVTEKTTEGGKSPGSEKTTGMGKSSGEKEETEKINIQAYKKKKDQMTVELDQLLEKLQEATRRRDSSAKEKITEEILSKSTKIYELTDEVTEKNKGKLPEGWW